MYMQTMLGTYDPIQHMPPGHSQPGFMWYDSNAGYRCCCALIIFLNQISPKLQVLPKITVLAPWTSQAMQIGHAASLAYDNVTSRLYYKSLQCHAILNHIQNWCQISKCNKQFDQSETLLRTESLPNEDTTNDTVVQTSVVEQPCRTSCQHVGP